MKRRLPHRAAAVALLAWRFLAAVVSSGWQTLRIIVHPPAATPGFVEYRFEPTSDTATTLLVCLICLTPGTTVVEVSASAGRMRLHLLDVSQDEAALQAIREEFETPIRVIFNSQVHS